MFFDENTGQKGAYSLRFLGVFRPKWLIWVKIHEKSCFSTPKYPKMVKTLRFSAKIPVFIYKILIFHEKYPKNGQNAEVFRGVFGQKNVFWTPKSSKI